MAVNEYDEILSQEPVGNFPDRQHAADQGNNEYDQAIQEDKDIQRQTMKQNMIVATRQDPAKKARALKISQDLKVPVAVVERNMDTFEQQTAQNKRDYDQIIDRTPGLAEWLQNADNAVFAKDDIDGLGKVEQGVRKIMKPEGETAKNPLMNAFSTGWSNLENASAHVAAAYGLMDLDEASQAIAASNLRSRDLREKAPEFSKEFNRAMEPETEDVDKAFNQFISSYESLANGNILQALVDWRFGGIKTVGETLDMVATAGSRPRGLIYATTENMANSLPALVGGASGAATGAAIGAGAGTVTIPGIGAVPGAVAGGTAGFFTGSLAGGVPVEVGAWINQALQERGVDVTDPDQIKEAYQDPVLLAEVRAEAERKGLTTAGIDALFSLFAGRFTAAAAGAKATKGQVATAFAKDLVVESTGEATSEFAGQVAAREGDLSKVSPGEAVFEGIIGMGHSTGQTVIGASVRGAFSQNTVKAAKQIARETKKAMAATEAGRAIGEMGQTIKDSKIGQIASDKVKEFVDSVTGKEQTASVFFQTDDWDSHFTKSGKSPVKAAEQLLKDGGQVYHEAKQGGGIMEIPMSEFVAEVGPTEEFEALQRIARVEPDGMSVTESTEFLNALPATMEELADEAVEMIDKPVEKNEAAERVREEVKAQLTEGGMEEQTAKNYSEVYEAAFASLGERTGVDPQDLFRQFGLSINISQQENAAVSEVAPKEVREGKTVADVLHEKRVKRQFKLEQAPLGKPSAPPFFSKLRRIIDQKMGPSATADQVRGITKEIKAEEKKWLGLDEFLKGKKKIDKKELQEFLKGNELNVKQVTKAAIVVKSEKDLPAGFKLVKKDRANFKWQIIGNAGPVGVGKTKKEAFEDFNKVAGKPKFDSYTLSGGTNYREVLLTLPPDLIGKKLPDDLEIIENTHLSESSPHRFTVAEKIKPEDQKLIDSLPELESRRFELIMKAAGEPLDTTVEDLEARKDKISDKVSEAKDKLTFSFGRQDGGAVLRIIASHRNDGIDRVMKMLVDRDLSVDDATDRDLVRNYMSALLEFDKTGSIISFIETGFGATIEDDPVFDKLESDIRKARRASERDIVGGGAGKTEQEALTKFLSNDRVFVNRSHFDEENILSFVRLKDRKSPDGKNVLFVEEVQSDWHAAGRKKGYLAESDLALIDQLPSLRLAEAKRLSELEEGRTKDEMSDIEDADEGLTAIREQIELAEKAEAAQARGAVADAPFRNNWHEFAFKNILRMAAEGGYDRVAWTTGDQQRDRYDLSRQVEQLDYDYDENTERYAISGQDLDGEWHQLGVYDEAALDEAVGKDLAKKMISHRGEGNVRGEFKDQDLIIGGEGLKKLYDGIYVNFMKKFVKKFNGKVEDGLIIVNEKTGEEDLSHSVDITPELRNAALGEGFSLFQAADRPRGQIRFGEASFNIDLLKDADLSTFLHETGHFYTEVLGSLAQQPDATPQIQEDFNTLVQWAGFESTQAWQDTPLEGRREAHEKIARGFEAYLMEGKAPTAKLQAAFDRFKTWLTSIYRTMRGLDVEITNDVRDVFNRLLATEDEIAQQNSDIASPPMFLEESGMNQADREKYYKAIGDAKRSANEELTTKMLDVVRKSRTKEWKARRKKIREEVEAEVNTEKRYVALSALQRGKYPDGSPFPADLKISRESLVDSFGAERTKNLPKPFIYTRVGGVHHENAAEILGYTSGEEMITDIEGAPKREALIEQETDARMNKEAGDLLNQENVAEEAEKAVANKNKSQRLHLELKHLASDNLAKFKGLIRTVNRKPPPLEAVRQQAEQTINSRKVRHITPGIYKRAQARHAKEAMDNLLKGDLDAAFLSKQRELFNHELHMAALGAKDHVDKAVKFIGKFGEKKTRQRIGKAGGQYLEQIDGIMERFDFRRGISLRKIDERKDLLAWVEDQRDNGYEPNISDSVMNEANRQHYKDLTFNQLKEVEDAVKSINHLSTLKNKLLKSTRLRTFEAARDEAIASIEANAGRVPKKQLESRLPQRDLVNIGAGYLASMRKFSSLIRQMDGLKDGGVMWETFVRPLNEAGDAEATRNEQAAVALNEILSKPYSLKDKRDFFKKQHIPEINDSLTKAGRISVALNWGNQDSRTKLMEGRGWTREQVEAILAGLDERDWNVVQNLWNFIDSYWKDTESLARRVDGVAPPKVEATPIQTRFGTFKGGYYPLKYDESASPRAFAHLAEEAAKRTMNGANVRSTTRSGHRKERVEGVRLPIRLDLGVAFEHVGQVIHDLTHYETLIDLNRLLGDPNMQDVIIDKYGSEIYGQLRNMLRDTASGDVPAQSAFERSINWLRAGTSIAAMGWNVMTAMQQPLGLTQSIVRVGPKWIARGVSRWLGDAKRMENTVAWIYDRSEFMRLRAKTQQREINEIRSTLRLKGALTKQAEDSYFWLIAKAQMVADVPTWLGAYEKAMAADATDEKRAAALADQAVLDSQGGGQVKDLAGIQRGGPLMKLWTNFYSYFNTTYNLTAESIAKTKFSDPSQVGRLAVDMLMLYTVPALLGMLIREAAKGDEPDEEFAKRAAREQLSYLLGTMVGVREVSGAVQGYYGYSGPAGTRFFAEAGGLVKQLEQGEVDEALLRSFNKTAGIFFHYPAGQVDRTVRGFVGVTKGESGPQSLLLGPPRK